MYEYDDGKKVTQMIPVEYPHRGRLSNIDAYLLLPVGENLKFLYVIPNIGSMMHPWKTIGRYNHNKSQH